MLFETIQFDMKQALKAGDKQKVSCLRMFMAAAKNKEIDLRRELDDNDCLAIVKSQVKQINDSIEQFTAAGRDDLAAEEKQNLAVLQNYLPAEMSSAEIEKIVDAVIAEMDATKKDFGKVMKEALARVAGQADGKAINSVVSNKLK